VRDLIAEGFYLEEDADLVMRQAAERWDAFVSR